MDRKLKPKLIIAVTAVAVFAVVGIAFATGVFGEKPYEGNFTLTYDSVNDDYFYVDSTHLEAHLDSLANSDGVSTITGDISKIEQTDSSWVYTTENPVVTYVSGNESKTVYLNGSKCYLSKFRVAIPKDLGKCGNDAYFGITLVGRSYDSDLYELVGEAIVLDPNGTATGYSVTSKFSDYKEALAKGDMLISGFDFGSISDYQTDSASTFPWSFDDDRVIFKIQDDYAVYGYKS